MAWVPAAAALTPHKTRAINETSKMVMSIILNRRFMELVCSTDSALFLQRCEDLGGGIGDEGGSAAGDPRTCFLGIVDCPNIAVQP